MPAKTYRWNGRKIAPKVKYWSRKRCRQLAGDLVAFAMAECPVDTGFLRDSHGIKEGSTRWGFTVYASAYYATFVHDGWWAYSGNPWMTRAVAQMRAKYRV